MRGVGVGERMSCCLCLSYSRAVLSLTRCGTGPRMLSNTTVFSLTVISKTVRCIKFMDYALQLRGRTQCTLLNLYRFFFVLRLAVRKKEGTLACNTIIKGYIKRGIYKALKALERK